MAEKSQIQWTDATWNRWFGCTKISNGCLACYIERTPPARINGWRFDRAGIGGRTPIVVAAEDRLYFPLRRQTGQLIFVNSLSDMWLAHPDLPLRLVAEMFAVMLLARQHIFQVFTKRAGRQAMILNGPAFTALVAAALETVLARAREHGRVSKIRPAAVDAARQHLADSAGGPLRPLPNLWLGATVEDDTTVHRIADLTGTPAAVRMLSVEPVTGPLTVTGRQLHDVGWVIIGGESGPAAKPGVLDPPGTAPQPLRPVDLDQVAQLIRVCQDAGVPVFVKQLGELWAREVGARHHKGGDPAEWPAHLRVREYPSAARALTVR